MLAELNCRDATRIAAFAITRFAVRRLPPHLATATQVDQRTKWQPARDQV